MRTMYYEQKGLINLDDIVDIFIEVGNIHNYLENAALRILLFGNPELNFYQCRFLLTCVEERFWALPAWLEPVVQN